jgi:type VI secretion system protein ImpL
MGNIREFLLSKISFIPRELIPVASIVMIIIAIALILVVFILGILFINAKPKPQIIRRDDKSTDQKKPPIAEKIRREDLPIISGRVGEILSLHGFLKVGPLTRIFFKVMEIIKNSTYDIRWRYKLPCFMMVGPPNSGKSTLLESLNFEHLTADGSAVDSMWKLFRRGAIFELPRAEADEDERNFWSFIGELFVFIRPRRPLDGIVVTLPMDMLLSDLANMEKMAREIFDRIFDFQHNLNFRLPIYIIVTKSDLIPGFAEFSHLLNSDSRQQIFGWSCPYSLNSAFSTSWIEEIFQTVESGIRKAEIYFSREKEASENLKKALLFRSRLRSIKPALFQYLYTMFQNHNPEEGLILRGVYFVGRAKEEDAASVDLIQPSALSPKLFANVDTNLAHSYNNILCFVQDLFKEKIFKEYNLARPIKVDAIDMNKAEYRNKIILATGSFVISVGWFIGNNNIKNKIHDYYQTMSSLKTYMVKIKSLEDNLRGEEDQALINKHTIQLLQNMPLVKWSDFSSVFVPQSWFSSLHNELTETLTLVFDSVVVRAMYIDLNLNTKSVLQKVSSESEANHEKKDLFDVNSFQSFKNLQEFIQRIINIKKISSEYNAIRRLEDRKSVVDLTGTIFKDKFNITEIMKTHVPNRKLVLPRFDIELFQPHIESNLRTLFGIFLSDVFDKTIEKILQSLASDIEKMLAAYRNAGVAYSSKDLAKVYDKTVLIADILKNKKFNWVASDNFVPNSEYAKMIEDLKASEIVGMDRLRELLRMAEIQFRQFKSRLLSFSTDLTGPLLSESIQTPSRGFEDFQKEIRALLDQPFIRSVSETNFVTTILEDKMLLWDQKRLKEISEMLDKYYEFSTTMPPAMRAQHFEMYQTIARKCMYPTLQSMLGNSQIFDDVPLGHSRNLLEDAYKRQSLNIRNSSAVIVKIVKTLDEIQEEDNQKDFGFSTLVISQYTSLLEKVDALFNLETPYSSGNALFDNWNGDRNPRFLNFDDQEGLKQYLTAQFERIKFLATIATPVVDLLSMQNIMEKVKNHSLLEKWKSIIASVADYEARKPGNSIAALETFISENLSRVSLESFDNQGEIKTIAESGGDYFLNKRSSVAKSLISRAEIVQYERASKAYNKINKLFNESLSHKFPFGNAPDDASLRDIEKFVDSYEQNSTGLYTTLESNRESKGVSLKALEFLKSMDKMIPFLKLWIAQSKGSDPNTAPVSFSMQLRPSPNVESLTSSLLDRKITINDSTVEDNAVGVFFNNDKINVVFNWVASADEKPYDGGSGNNPLIQGTKVTFSYGGRWAMLRLIEEHRISKETALPQGVLLQFQVPIVDSSKENEVLTSKIVLKITPMTRDGDKLTPLEWPVFPEFCPDLYGHERSIDLEKSVGAAPPSGNLDTAVSFDKESPAPQPATEVTESVQASEAEETDEAEE